MPAFVEWASAASDAPLRELLLDRVFEIMVCRIEEAVAQRANDPIRAISNGASAYSRAATRSMLTQLGFSTAQIRIVQRLMAGSAGGWPGLIRLYLSGEAVLTTRHRRYVDRQVQAFRDAATRGAVPELL
jgi:hypothetical protein